MRTSSLIRTVLPGLAGRHTQLLSETSPPLSVLPLPNPSDRAARVRDLLRELPAASMTARVSFAATYAFGSAPVADRCLCVGLQLLGETYQLTPSVAPPLDLPLLRDARAGSKRARRPRSNRATRQGT